MSATTLRPHSLSFDLRRQIEKYLVGDVRERRTDSGRRRQLGDQNRRLADDGVDEQLRVHFEKRTRLPKRRQMPGSSPASAFVAGEKRIGPAEMNVTLERVARPQGHVGGTSQHDG